MAQSTYTDVQATRYWTAQQDDDPSELGNSGRATTTTTIEMTADPLCHISLIGVLHRTDLDLDPSI